ncbi:SLAP domain-containing protein [Kurthia zopfii]|uniref:SLAP domain-containing protein n=1 Tax=Kurthia zopfii TaxID=1650 RepID=UPI000F6E7A46|nr:SLAP domain-containing protein [Kurthia zopfii]VEI06524.1 Uncharacterised protein [Kurthia zopfii]
MNLSFEKTWENAIAPIDRQAITQLFEDTKDSQERYSHYKSTTNHRGHTLITLLIHNRSDQPLLFNHTEVAYENNVDFFTIPKLIIPPKTSTPWCFIYKNKGTAQVD